jgi:hypothetical protein
MLTITNNDIDKYGGLLSAISAIAVNYLKNNIKVSKDLSYVSKHLLRTIVHINPHLDEYYSELIFRTCLNIDMSNIEFVEEAIYSENDDLLAQELWPQAVVFGIGSTISPGSEPLMKFDEHIKGKGRFSDSCAELVTKYITNNNLKSLSNSVLTLLKEVNSIDAFGKAHPQNLGNIIKTLHNVRFMFSKGDTPKDDVRDKLTPSWKRSIIDAFLVSIVYALDENLDLINDPKEKKNFLLNTLKIYKSKSLHVNNPLFEKAYNFISSEYGDQAKVFSEAILRDADNNNILDNVGNTIPQLLLLSRVCYSSYSCWGEEIAEMLMMHIWESELQKQMNFLTIEKELESNFDNTQIVQKRTLIGEIGKRTLTKVMSNKIIKDRIRNKIITSNEKCPLEIIFISPSSGIFEPHKAATNYINDNNFRFGLVLVEDSYLGTKALFRTEGFPKDRWIKLVKVIMDYEPNCWYDATKDPSKPAYFIVNGTLAHQYVKRSGIDLESLTSLVERIWK